MVFGNLIQPISPAPRPLAPTDAQWVTYTKVPRLEPGSAEALEYLDREGYW